ncbi:hypothetical protein NDA01_10710 [Trichocoleus desertorum AS-A10]
MEGLLNKQGPFLFAYCPSTSATSALNPLCPPTRKMAYVLALYEDTALVKLEALLQPFGLTYFTQMLGELIYGCLILSSTLLEKRTPKRWSANI